MAGNRLETYDGITFLVTPDGQRYRYADVLAYNNPGMKFDPKSGAPLTEDAPAPAEPPQEATLSSYTPTAQEDFVGMTSDAYVGLMDYLNPLTNEFEQRQRRWTGNDIGERIWGKPSFSPQADGLTNLLDSVGLLGATPLGAAPSAIQAKRDIEAGNYGSAALNAGATALELAPVVGKAAGRGLRAAPGKIKGVYDDIIDRLNQPGPMPTTFSNPIPGLLGGSEQRNALEDVLRAKYPGVKLSLTGDASKGYKLNQIIVPEEQRGSGVGSAIMRDIADAADQQGATVSLSPSADFGGSVGRLKEFYSRFGFVPNKGKSKDFAISESMYRLPKSDFPGLLPSAVSAPADEVAVRGSEIVDLLKSGRADEVTDAMLDMGDPVANARLNEYLFNSYDLPMDAASRKARAEQMGFSSALHGTGSDFTAVDPAYFGNGKDLLGSGFYTSTNPSRADVYVPRERTPGIEVRKGYAEGGNVMPLSVREPRPFILEDVQGQSADDIAASFAQDPSFSRSTTSSGVNYVTDVDGNRILLDPMQQKHYAVQNIRKEFGPSEVTTVLSDLGYSGVSGPEALGHRVRVAFDPADVRSRFARFDPRLAHLKNLNAALAAGAPLGLLAMQPDEEY